MWGVKCRYILNILMLIAFVLVLFTGIIKQPFLARYFISMELPMAQVSSIHDLSGLVLLVLVIIHCSSHWRWWVSVTRGLFGGKE